MITSRQNPKIQRAHDLLTRSKDRRDANAFVVEGVRLVEEAALAGWAPRLVLYTENLSLRGQELVQKLAAEGVEVEMVTEAVMAAATDTQSSQGILAVCPQRHLPFPVQLDFVLIADAIRDPGNMGTILRSAAAAGVSGVLLTPGTVDVFSPKVVRSAMGAHFRLPILALEWDSLEKQLITDQRSNPIQIFLTEAGQGQVIWQVDLRQRLALIIGNEAEGPSPAARRLATSSLQIPMPGYSESLNAAAAASILMFEVVRQRSQPPLE